MKKWLIKVNTSSLHISQAGEALKAEAWTRAEPDLGEVRSFPCRLLNRLQIIITYHPSSSSSDCLNTKRLHWFVSIGSIKADICHLLGRPLHKELVELPVKEEEGAGEAEGGQEKVFGWHHHSSLLQYFSNPVKIKTLDTAAATAVVVELFCDLFFRIILSLRQLDPSQPKLHCCTSSGLGNWDIQ